MSDFTAKVNSSKVLSVRLKQRDGDTATLTGSTVTFSCWDWRDKADVKVNNLSVTIDSATPPADPDENNVSFHPDDHAFTWPVGKMHGHFKVVTGGGIVEYFPDDEYLLIEVGDSP